MTALPTSLVDNWAGKVSEALVVHRDGIIVYASPQACMHLRCDPDDVVGSAIVRYVHPESLMTIIERINEMGPEIGAEAPWNRERFVRADGTVFEAEVCAERILFESRPAVAAILRAPGADDPGDVF